MTQTELEDKPPVALSSRVRGSSCQACRAPELNWLVLPEAKARRFRRGAFGCTDCHSSARYCAVWALRRSTRSSPKAARFPVPQPATPPVVPSGCLPSTRDLPWQEGGEFSDGMRKAWGWRALPCNHSACEGRPAGRASSRGDARPNRDFSPLPRFLGPREARGASACPESGESDNSERILSSCVHTGSTILLRDR
jgi:hypothetical protein